MRARNAMTKLVSCAKEDWTTAQAAAMLRAYGYRALPVVDERERMVGIVTEADLLPDPLSGDQLAQPRTVGGVMTTAVWFVYEDTPLAVVEHRMRTTGVPALPVVRHGKVAGIITRRDLLAAGRPGWARRAVGN